MIQIAPSLRRGLHAALALLVVVSMGHCAWEWHAVLGQKAAAAAYRAKGQSLPILPDRGCHNETGCMCRGATPVAAVDVAHFAASAGDWLPVIASACAPRSEQPARRLPATWSDAPPSLFGRQLRALFASLVI